MCSSAAKRIQESLGDVPINVEKFKDSNAFGDGAAIM